MRKKAESKQAKANRVLRESAVAASAASAIREPPPDTWPVRMPPYAYTSLRPDPGLRRPPEGVIWYHETVLHRQRERGLCWTAQQQGQDTVRVLGMPVAGCGRR